MAYLEEGEGQSEPWMDRWPPRIRDLPNFQDENHFRNYLAKMFLNQGWAIVQKEKQALNSNDRCDLILYDRFHQCNLFIELKIPESFNDITKSLVQLMRYRNLDWGIRDLYLYTLITPYSIPEGAVRFFWRFGFGVGSLDTKTIRFNEGMSYSMNYQWTRSNGTVKKTIALMEKLRSGADF